MIARFVIIGGLNGLVALVVFSALEALLKDYRLAAIIAVPICVLFSHATMGRLVFDRPGLRSLLPFALLYAVLGVINAVIITAVVGLGQPPLVGQILALPVIAVLSFFINKNLVFRQA
jgi:putative flippase GtrA